MKYFDNFMCNKRQTICEMPTIKVGIMHVEMCRNVYQTFQSGKIIYLKCKFRNS